MACKLKVHERKKAWALLMTEIFRHQYSGGPTMLKEVECLGAKPHTQNNFEFITEATYIVISYIKSIVYEIIKEAKIHCGISVM